MQKIRDWFTDTRRQAIYAAVAALAPVLVYGGIIAEGAVEHVLTITTVALQAGAGLLALVNFSPRQAASWFINAGRATVYAAAALLAPAAEGLGWADAEQTAAWLTALSLGLTGLASVLAVLFIGSDRSEPADGDSWPEDDTLP